MTDFENKKTNSSTPTGWNSNTPITGCAHQRLVSGKRQINCLEWGLYIPRTENMTLREHENVSFFAEVALDEVLDNMKTIMNTNRPYSPKPNYLRYRRYVVDWMWEIGDTINLDYTTIHHSVALMDTYFSIVEDITTDKSSKEFLQLIALTSIFISAKFREKDSRGPTAWNISILTKGQYSEKQILDWERNMLNVIGWKLHFATPADFLILLLNQGIIFEWDDIFKSKKSNLTEPPSIKVVQYVRKFAEFFVDLCLQEYDFQKYDSHTLACSIILAARRAVHFKKTWNEEFEHLFNCSFNDVQDCYKTIYKFYMASFPSKQESRPKHYRSKHVQEKTKASKNNSLSWRSNSANTINQNNQKFWSARGFQRDIKSNYKTNTSQKSGACKNKTSSTTRITHKTSVPRVASSKVSVNRLHKNGSSMLKNPTITTPDKPFITHHEMGSNNTNSDRFANHKLSSSNKKSSIKGYKPDLQHHRAPRPAFYDSNQRKPKISTRNCRVNSRIQTKLDFGSQNGSLSRSRKSIQPSTSSYKQMTRANWSTISDHKENIPTYTNYI